MDVGIGQKRKNGKCDRDLNKRPRDIFYDIIKELKHKIDIATNDERRADVIKYLYDIYNIYEINKGQLSELCDMVKREILKITKSRHIFVEKSNEKLTDKICIIHNLFNNFDSVLRSKEDKCNWQMTIYKNILEVYNCEIYKKDINLVIFIVKNADFCFNPKGNKEARDVNRKIQDIKDEIYEKLLNEADCELLKKYLPILKNRKELIKKLVDNGEHDFIIDNIIGKGIFEEDIVIDFNDEQLIKSIESNIVMIMDNELNERIAKLLLSNEKYDILNKYLKFNCKLLKENSNIFTLEEWKKVYDHLQPEITEDLFNGFNFFTNISSSNPQIGYLNINNENKRLWILYKDVFEKIWNNYNCNTEKDRLIKFIFRNNEKKIYTNTDINIIKNTFQLLMPIIFMYDKEKKMNNVFKYFLEIFDQKIPPYIYEKLWLQMTDDDRRKYQNHHIIFKNRYIYDYEKEKYIDFIRELKDNYHPISINIKTNFIRNYEINDIKKEVIKYWVSTVSNNKTFFDLSLFTYIIDKDIEDINNEWMESIEKFSQSKILYKKELINSGGINVYNILRNPRYNTGIVRTINLYKVYVELFGYKSIYDVKILIEKYKETNNPKILENILMIYENDKYGYDKYIELVKTHGIITDKVRNILAKPFKHIDLDELMSGKLKEKYDIIKDNFNSNTNISDQWPLIFNIIEKIEDIELKKEIINSYFKECPICFEHSLIREVYMMNTCGHTLCEDCSNELLSNNCPECRANAEPIKIYY